MRYNNRAYKLTTHRYVAYANALRADTAQINKGVNMKISPACVYTVRKYVWQYFKGTMQPPRTRLPFLIKLSSCAASLIASPAGCSTKWGYYRCVNFPAGYKETVYSERRLRCSREMQNEFCAGGVRCVWTLFGRY